LALLIGGVQYSKQI